MRLLNINMEVIKEVGTTGFVTKGTTLILTKSESEWLHQYMQNAFIDISREDPIDSDMRRLFFLATS